MCPSSTACSFPAAVGVAGQGREAERQGEGRSVGATKKRRGPRGVTSQEFGQSESRQEPFVIMCHKDSDALGSSSST